MLGICVVYLVPDAESQVLLRLSLQKLRALTAGDCKIYGCAQRLAPEHLPVLREFGVELPALPLSKLRWAAEHSFYLDHLADYAFADGCTHVATFDLDSWPLVPGWNRLYQERLTPAAPVAGVVRSEVGDNFPYPAFTMLHRSFWNSGASSFNTGLRAHFDPGIVEKIRRPGETGAGILAQLIRDDRYFFPLYRTNTWNPHRLMGGVYANTFFHLAAGSRAPEFITDNEEFALNGSLLRNQYRDAVNTAKRKFMLDALAKNETALVNELIGTENGPSDFSMIKAGNSK